MRTSIENSPNEKSSTNIALPTLLENRRGEAQTNERANASILFLQEGYLSTLLELCQVCRLDLSNFAGINY